MAMRYMDLYGVKEEDAARVAVRDRSNALNNPYAHLQLDITIEDVMKSPMISYPVKYLDMCPRTDGACAVVFASEDVAEKITPKPAWVHGTTNRHNYAVTGDPPWDNLQSLDESSNALYDKLGIKEPLKEFDVAELYFPCSWSGLAWVEDLGFCKRGEGPKLVWDGATDMGGELPINPSGGVLSSNPIGATGLQRTAEAALQIMGKADKRQVPDAKLALISGFGGCFWSDLMILGADKPK
jgi:acetyl-CoA C-acetyltransferase